MDCSTVIGAFSVVVSMLSVLFVIVLSWQIIRINRIKKEILKDVDVKISLEREKMFKQMDVQHCKILVNLAAVYYNIFILAYETHHYDIALVYYTRALDTATIPDDGVFNIISDAADRVNKLFSHKFLMSEQTKDLCLRSIHNVENAGIKHQDIEKLKLFVLRCSGECN